jgi:thiol-disulfide isomerase/thioredoxin
MTRFGLAAALCALLAMSAAAVAAAADAPALRPATAAELLAAVRQPGAKAVLVNVWATWCIPCREEMPGLLRLRRDYAARGLRLILISGDFSSEAPQAATFLGELGVDFPTYLKQGSDMEFIDAFDPKWSGALPATFIYDGTGTLQDSIFGPQTYEEFEKRIGALLE